MMARDHHYHACACGEVWDHMTPPDEASDAEYEAAHRCQQCGRQCRTKYTAAEAGDVKRNPGLAEIPTNLPPAFVVALLLELLSHG